MPPPFILYDLVSVYIFMELAISQIFTTHQQPCCSCLLLHVMNMLTCRYYLPLPSDRLHMTADYFTAFRLYLAIRFEKFNNVYSSICFVDLHIVCGSGLG